MDEAVAFFNTRKDLNFLINLGDIVNNDLMWNLKPILDSFNKAKAPHYHILGNHDRRAHNDRFGEKNVTQEKWLMEKLGLKKWHYSFVVPPFRFLCLDSMIMELKGDARRKRHMDWLETELTLSVANKEHVIIFGHIVIGLNTNVLGPILKRFTNIVAMFFGHHHKGGYTKQGSNVHTVIIQGQIETMTNAFALCEVYHNRIEMTGFGRVPTRVFPFSVEVTALIEEREKEHLARPEGDRTYNLGKIHQPAPPSVLWINGGGQGIMPPIKFPIQGFHKPTLEKALPNAGTTIFYVEWKTGATPEEVRATELSARSTEIGSSVEAEEIVQPKAVTSLPTRHISLNPMGNVISAETLDLWSYVLVMPSVLLCFLALLLTLTKCKWGKGPHPSGGNQSITKL